MRKLLESVKLLKSDNIQWCLLQRVMQRGYPTWETVISQQSILLHLVCQSDVAKEHLVCNVETKDASGKNTQHFITHHDDNLLASQLKS